ncbi:hypothetical protein [Sphingomonas sp. CFBP 13706]|uniref:hypothetical protein n=1 Tax=Sphingomonas sp. CFBP 13706 TaxID=2775314 RepID=UPI001781E313|nr:hypothetical protein [Sphingomonas sp. CFBP 13706]MBD8734913.1 hypothetical protein [Sphingomonas sp. CFBP 13706]
MFTIMTTIWEERQDARPLLTKRITQTPQGWSKADYDEAYLYDAIVETDTHDLAGLVDLLRELEGDPHSCLIRGEPIAATRSIRRALRDDPKRGAATIRPVDGGQPWVMLDMDKHPVASLGFTTNQQRLDYLVSQLPACFQEVSYYYQWSSSAGLDNWQTLSAHFWFWLDRPWNCRDLYERFHSGDFKDNGVDYSPFTPNQPHYTAFPIFTNCADPLGADRAGLVIKPLVEATLPPFIRVIPPKPEFTATEHHRRFPFTRFEALLNDIGPGYHHEVRRAIAHYVSVVRPHEYDRYDLVRRVQDAIMMAPAGKNRKADYSNDRYLNRLIDGAERKYRWGVSF